MENYFDSIKCVPINREPWKVLDLGVFLCESKIIIYCTGRPDKGLITSMTIGNKRPKQYTSKSLILLELLTKISNIFLRS